jgi:hypothetical protein
MEAGKNRMGSEREREREREKQIKEVRDRARRESKMAQVEK